MEDRRRLTRLPSRTRATRSHRLKMRVAQLCTRVTQGVLGWIWYSICLLSEPGMVTMTDTDGHLLW